MNVAQLIQKLQLADPNLPVCWLHESGPIEVMDGDVGIYKGSMMIDSGPKMIAAYRNQMFLALGNTGDFESLKFVDVCEPIKLL